MREFFRGWRRKIGIATLVTACAFSAAWARSFNFGDCVVWNSMLISEHGNLYCVPPQQLTMSWKWPEWHVDVVSADVGSSFEQITWIWQLMGYGIGVFTIFRTNFLVILFPYWSIVIPLTLMSAYLLLSKPRPRTPPESTIPSDEAQVTHA